MGETKVKIGSKEWLLRLLILFIGLVIAHLGVTLFVITELGTDCFTVLIQGIARTIGGVSIGTVHMIALVLIMALMLVTTKGYIKMGSVICAFCGGPIIDVFMLINNGTISSSSPMYVRGIVLVLGLVILGFGMSVVIKSQAGTGPNDLIAIVLTDFICKIKKVEFRWVRMTCDAVFTLVGFLLGGTVGVGTVVAVLMIGPVVQFFLPKSEKVIEKLVK